MIFVTTTFGADYCTAPSFGPYMTFFGGDRVLFPPFNMGEGIVRVVLFYYFGPTFGRYDTPLSWDVAGRSIVYLLILTLLFVVLTMAMEGGQLRRLLAVSEILT